MITAPSPGRRAEILRRHRTGLADRIARAQASLELIDCALACAHADFTRCPHFQAVVAERLGIDTADYVPR